MAQTILLKRSAVAGKVPTTSDIPLGSIALNTADGKLYTKKSVGGVESIVELSGGGGASVTTSDTAPTNPADGDLWYDSAGGRLYCYYEDGDSGQWVDAAPQAAGSPSVTTLPNGTSAAPSVAFANSSSTGLYSPGSGQLGLSTNGTGRLLVDASGNVGIGVSNSNVPLDVAADSSAIAYRVRGRSSDNIGEIQFTDNARTTAYASLRTPEANTFSILTGGSERLRFSSTGLLGIGTASPSAGLDLIADGTGNTRSVRLCAPGTAQGNRVTLSFYTTFEGTADNGPRRTADIRAGFNGGPWGSEYLAFHVGSNSSANDSQNLTSEKLRIDGAGRIGLGQTAPATTVDVNGAQSANIVSVGALDINCAAGNYFIKTINGASTFTVSNVPSSRVYSFTLELTHTSGAVTWFSGIEWPGGTAPTLTTGKTHLFMFITDDGGARWRAASQVNYNN